jgi:hypothetical protein
MQADPRDPCGHMPRTTSLGSSGLGAQGRQHLPPDFHWDTYRTQTFTNAVATKEHEVQCMSGGGL